MAAGPNAWRMARHLGRKEGGIIRLRTRKEHHTRTEAVMH
jgi:hypothetical protein